MNEAEQFWQEHAKKLRRLKGLCPLTPKEAEEALKKVPYRKPSDAEIDSIVEAVTRGELPEPEESKQVDWSPDCDYAQIDHDAALCRNEGDQNPQTDGLEDELLEELLEDVEPENDCDGMED